MKGIRSQSRKAKGRRLQQWAASEFKRVFTHLEGNDVRSLSMGASGADLILSPAALEVLPYDFEMKNVENFEQWATLKQVYKRIGKDDFRMPCVVVKRNHKDPLAIIPLGHFFHLLRCERDAVGDEIPAEPVVWQATAKDILRSLGIDLGRLHEAVEAGVKLALRDVATAHWDGYHLRASPTWKMTFVDKSRFKFWTVWDDTVADAEKEGVDPVLVFNGGDLGAIPHVAMTFDRFVALLKARWCHVRQAKIRALLAE